MPLTSTVRPGRRSFSATLLALLMVSTSFFATQAEDAMQRGKTAYLANCLICHQLNGQGTPGVYPPLAKSDFLMADVERSIQFVVAGYSGPITVNGRKYDNTMPPALLDDQQTADVMTYIRNSWGNEGAPVTREEVSRVRAKTQFPTFEALKAANGYRPLPAAPAGLKLREVFKLAKHQVRLASDGSADQIFMLAENGDVSRLSLADGQLTQILRGKSYRTGANGSALGFTFSKERRLYVVANEREESGSIITNNVTIYRSTTLEDGIPGDLKPWARGPYPWGIGPYNHGAGHIAFGPDGMLYVSSGSRTDGNEQGTTPGLSTMGEHPLTACIWRLDPAKESPEIEVFAKGLRNPWSFCWDDKGMMVATDNGPDADAPEELNVVEKGRHYGFPFQFSDWDKKPYPYTPDLPAGVTVTRPVINLGPAAGGSASAPLSTFNPHSSPSGIVYLGDDFPAPYRGGFLLGRFGNLLQTPKDVGFDVLLAHVRQDGKAFKSDIQTILEPLGRPIDLLKVGKGRVFILEFCRSTDFKSSMGFPGRILELSVVKD